ncbi:hypothetical protein R1sor_009049 [Riccia sorocarpa]|uniref:Uncharacterized protein n=1 Tax=Riccia sorocarpa TaxID=122646 RepID=A0ABD3H4P4_9MARC
MQTYIQRFQYLTSLMTPALTEEVLLSAFKRGLPDHIHNWLTLQKVNSLTGALAEARTYAQCEERDAQIPDPTYYIPGLKGQVMINPYMSPTMGSPSAVPFIPGASLVPTPHQPPTSWFQNVLGVDVHQAPAIPFIPTAGAYPALAPTAPQIIPQAVQAHPTAQPPPATAAQANATPTAQNPTFATTDQVAQLMVKLEQIHLNQTDPNRQPINTAARGQVACTRCNGTGQLQIAQGALCTYCAKRGHLYEDFRTRVNAAQIQPQVAQVAQVNAIGARQNQPQANHGNPPQYNAQLQAPHPATGREMEEIKVTGVVKTPYVTIVKAHIIEISAQSHGQSEWHIAKNTNLPLVLSFEHYYERSPGTSTASVIINCPLPRQAQPMPRSDGASSSTTPPSPNASTTDTVVPVHIIKHRDLVVPVTIDGHVIPDCLIDSGSSINVIPLETMRALGLTGIRSTSVLLRMADGRNTRPVGEMKNVPTLIGEQPFLIDYIVMDMSHPPQFPLLLGVP